MPLRTTSFCSSSRRPPVSPMRNEARLDLDFDNRPRENSPEINVFMRWSRPVRKWTADVRGRGGRQGFQQRVVALAGSWAPRASSTCLRLHSSHAPPCSGTAIGLKRPSSINLGGVA
eukprot:CAMPEP_0174724508 /NCGR_PEP_ID=MMETSP1094-20130205/43453_1 /TAXON_ID=156173 /ORGANISM="Chrysochromulina brevifilum, Strain UTEX LB 985" /LENGTH=116 /DNA_ID=CAMNT_0015925735 /DNA_START=330 /DNA_END=677 /DNA_ORIENTATION=+